MFEIEVRVISRIFQIGGWHLGGMFFLKKGLAVLGLSLWNFLKLFQFSNEFLPVVPARLSLHISLKF